MKTKYLNIFFTAQLTLLLCIFAYLSYTLYPALVGKALVFCSTCLSFILPLLQNILFAIFALALISLMLIIFKTLKFKNRLKVSSKQPRLIRALQKKYPSQIRIVIIDDNEPLAFCLGFISPNIYVSSGLLRILSPLELEAVILHEKHHVDQSDNFLSVLLHILKNTLFFLPVIGDAVSYLQVKKEIEADRQVIKQLGQKSSLVSALRKVLEFSSPQLASISAFASHRGLDTRIQSLIGPERKNYQIPLRSIILSLSVILIATNFTLSKIEVHQQVEQASALCFDKGNCQSICR